MKAGELSALEEYKWEPGNNMSPWESGCHHSLRLPHSWPKATRLGRRDDNQGQRFLETRREIFEEKTARQALRETATALSELDYYWKRRDYLKSASSLVRRRERSRWDFQKEFPGVAEMEKAVHYWRYYRYWG